MQKLIDLLDVFRLRGVDPALVGHTSYTQEAFTLAATELELAMRESEPPNLIAYVPPACITLVHEALHFDPNDEDSWEALGCAALEVQSGEAS